MAVFDCKPLPTISKTAVRKFWAKVNKTPGQGPNGDCWEWVGARFKRGYGAKRVKGKVRQTHRIAYFLQHGIDPYPLLVRHSCDNPPCCNGAHLLRGMPIDNTNDRTQRGRSARGDANGSRLYPERLARGADHPSLARVSKITPDQVCEIRSIYAIGGTSQAEIAKVFGLCQTQIGRIVRRTRWAFVA